MTRNEAAWALANCFAAGETDPEAIAARASLLLGRRWRWLRPLAVRYLKTFGGKTRPRQAAVESFLRADAGFQRASESRLNIAEYLAAAPRMLPAPAAAAWNVPAIATSGDLAGWLSLTHGELEWFAGRKGLARKAHGSLSHYRYREIIKPSGHLRLIEAPKPRLKEIQRRILNEILNRVPAHPAAHGFVPGRSIQTFAAPHIGRRVVLKMDLQDFFPSIRAARVQALFRAAGYPETVADLLGNICTNIVPRAVLAGREPAIRQQARDLYCRPHLPQGAPTSPALANLCAYRLDCRLTGFAESLGARYSRYADDLAFSGGPEFEQAVERLPPYVAAIAAEEGFAVHHRKTRVMRASVRQQIAGLIVNERLNTRRADFDRLKAILTNCARHGPEGQNREGHPQFRAHLNGRVAFVESIHAERGACLRSLFERIDWGELVVE